jgi:hypothetical protein
MFLFNKRGWELLLMEKLKRMDELWINPKFPVDVF